MGAIVPYIPSLNTVYDWDALQFTEHLPTASVNCIVTSPPYYWQRDYGDDRQLGHEQTPDAFVKALVKVFKAAKRVLREDGVLYLNLADTYYSGNGQPGGSDPRSPSRNFMRTKLRPVDVSGWDIPKKSLIGIPHKVAFALQADGWTWRSTIVWNRQNAFSEPSVTDRPHRQYELLFLFSKARRYWYDRTALDGEEDVWNITVDRSKWNNGASFPEALASRCIRTGCPEKGTVLDMFGGACTTAALAKALDRNWYTTDLNPAIGRLRIAQVAMEQMVTLPMFAA